MSERIWKQVTIRATSDMEDALSDFLTTLTGRGVCIREDRGRILIDAYLEPGMSEEHLLRIDRNLEDLVQMGLLPEGWRYEVMELPEEDWMEVFRSQHTTILVSDRLVVRPTWCEPTGDREVVLDPGMAFGTGGHFTTRMCLVLLDDIIGDRPPGRMFDLGTGSGILAIAGGYLGVSETLGVDIDPVAVEVATRNVFSNAVDDRVAIAEGSVEAAEGLYDIITANLSASVLKRLAPEITGHLAPGGGLIISGILEEEQTDVTGAFTQCGLRVERVVGEKVWIAALLQRPR